MENNSILLEQVTDRAKQWLSEYYDNETKKQVQELLDKEDKTALLDAFYRDLEFGTGGLRGIMGVGSNRVNKYTIGAATQGLANYLKIEFENLPQIKVAVCHDCRNNSRYFAELVAEIFSANGIKAYLFEDLRPTPLVSYAIRKLGCQSGVNITASHNPKEYNGYKVYWEDGAQVIPPHDKNIITEVNRVSVSDIKFDKNEKLIEIISEQLEIDYIQDVQKILLSKESIKRHGDIPIVYTPIHGTGLTMIPKTLKACGFTNIIHVPEQDVLDGNFPTVNSPNPENPSALAMAVEKAKATNAEVVLATDPDADRYAMVVKNEKGEYDLINGNQAMCLLVYYIITRKKELGQLTGKDYLLRTIVTSELTQVIAEANGVQMFETYTGFKWIAAVIRELENKQNYIGGGEESFGFLAEDFVRDKDGISAVLMCAELNAWAKDQGKNVSTILKELYLQYGYSKEVGISVVKEGMEGAKEIDAMMKRFRENPPQELAGSKVVLAKDFVTLKATDMIKNEVSGLKMPTTSNVLQFFTEDKTKVSIRPSGTEPKIKFYIEVKDKMTSINDYELIDKRTEEKIKAICSSLGL